MKYYFEHPRDSHEIGFSAVELLITLFIGAIFLISGYQLYAFSFARNAGAGQDARASDLAYDILQSYKRGEITDEANGEDCSEHSVGSRGEDTNNDGIDEYLGLNLNEMPNTTQPFGTRDLNITLASLLITCPYNTQDLKGLKRVTSSITYRSGSATKTATHAEFQN